MKALGILMIGAACLLAGCACDCDDRLGANGNTVGTTVGTTGNDAAGTDANNPDNAWGDVGTTSKNNTGNTSTSGDNNATGSNTTTNTGTAPKAEDPRTYNQSGGGMGYRTDTINEYDGIDGSARDKTNSPTKKP